MNRFRYYKQTGEINRVSHSQKEFKTVPTQLPWRKGERDANRK